jgi:creatinine amidohydrolase/Fe(II)-dependent formamide hydrolase-like protein
LAKFIWVEPVGIFTYALDECEDYLVLDAYLHIRDSGKFDKAKHISAFEFYHLEKAGTLNDNILLQLNSSLRQLGRPYLKFVNGHTTNHAALRGADKVARRQAILDQLRSLAPKQREELIAKKEAEANRLPERSGEVPLRAPEPVGGLNRNEIEKRGGALAKSHKSDAGRAKPSGVEAVAVPAVAGNGEADSQFVPESTVQDNVVELITEMRDLRAEVASLKTIMQTVFNLKGLLP